MRSVRSALDSLSLLFCCRVNCSLGDGFPVLCHGPPVHTLEKGPEPHSILLPFDPCETEGENTHTVEENCLPLSNAKPARTHRQSWATATARQEKRPRETAIERPDRRPGENDSLSVWCRCSICIFFSLPARGHRSALSHIFNNLLLPKKSSPANEASGANVGEKPFSCARTYRTQRAASTPEPLCEGRECAEIISSSLT